MEVVFVVNGLGFSAGMPIGGADKRALELGKCWQEKGVTVTYLTTDAGEAVLRQWGARATFLTVKRPFFWPKFLENNLLGRVLSYFYVIFADILISFRFSNFQLPPSTLQFIYPTSDMFFDLLPAAVFKWRRPSARLVGIVHHDIPAPFQRPGNFLANLLLFFSQRFGFWLLKLWADLVLYPQTAEGEKIRKTLEGYGLATEKLASFCNGVNLTELAVTPPQKKKYTACFVGGLRPSKGIFDLVPLWQEVRRQLPTATLLVVGGGLSRYEEALKREIKKTQLEEAIVLAGVVPQPALFKLLKSCQIFLSVSYEEGWGIALLEALAGGLPAVVYDLPAYQPFGAAVIRVKVGDWRALAVELVKLCQDPASYQRQVSLGQVIVQDYDWKKLAEDELHLLRNLGKND